LIAFFELFPHRAIRINLLTSFVTLALAAASRLSFLRASNLADYRIEILGLLAGGVVAAWFGASLLSCIPKTHHGRDRPITDRNGGATRGRDDDAAWTLLSHDSMWVEPAAFVAGLFVGTISSLLGVAGGEFIIPILIFAFGADIKTAGTASVLISLPVVLTGVARHWLTGHYRSQTMLTYLVLPMCIGSLIGATVGGYLAAWAPTDALRIVLAAILAVSSVGRGPPKRTRRPRCSSSCNSAKTVRLI
jgi:uncharacterized protein